MAGSSAHPLVISALALLVSIPFLVMMAFASKTKLDFKTLREEARTPFLKLLITRAIIGQFLIVTGFTMTSAVKSVLLLRLEPVFVFIWGILLYKNKPQLNKIGLLVMLLFGSALVVLPPPGTVSSTDGPNLGDALVVLSLLFLSYSYGPTKQVIEKSNPITVNLASNLLGGIVLGCAAWFVPNAYQLQPNTIWLIIGYSFVFFVIAVTLYFEAFKTLEPWIIASFLSLEVVFGLVLAATMLNEKIDAIQLVGAAIVLASTVLIGRLPKTAS